MSLAFTVSVWRSAAVQFAPHPSVDGTLIRQEEIIWLFVKVSLFLQAEENAPAVVFTVRLTLNPKKAPPGPQGSREAFSQLLSCSGRKKILLWSSMNPLSLRHLSRLNSPFAGVTWRYFQAKTCQAARPPWATQPRSTPRSGYWLEPERRYLYAAFTGRRKHRKRRSTTEEIGQCAVVMQTRGLWDLSGCLQN